MDNGKLGVCIVGCSDLGTKHAERWNNLSEARVVSVCDIRPELGEKLAHTCGLDRWYADYHEAVDLPEVDVVSVCIPTHLHPKVTIAAADKGKHVLSEKPIALTLADAQAMIEAAERNHVKLSIGFMRRYSPIVHHLRQWLGEGGLGRPVMYYSVDQRELRPKREMHDPNANGGPIIDMGVHLYDGWSYLFESRPVQVFAQGLKLVTGRPEISHIPEPAYDTATVQVRYESGDLGTFIVTWGLPPATDLGVLADVIYGPKGVVNCEFGIGHQEARVMVEGGAWERLASSDIDMYQCEIGTLARCILDDRPLPVTGADGKAALRVALAALESIRTGQAVSLV